MRKFTDNSGQSWEIQLPLGAVLRVKSGTEGRFNLLDAKAHADQLANDEGEFWEVLWHLVEQQAEARSITPQKFGELIGAASLHEARRAFFEEWADFFRQLHRLDKATVVEKVAEYLEKAIQMTKDRLATEGPELDQLIEKRMRENLNDSFGSLRASLELTPAHSPGKS